jgi:cysteinyl-tRNA synthetase
VFGVYEDEINISGGE